MGRLRHLARGVFWQLEPVVGDEPGRLCFREQSQSVGAHDPAQEMAMGDGRSRVHDPPESADAHDHDDPAQLPKGSQRRDDLGQPLVSQNDGDDRAWLAMGTPQRGDEKATTIACAFSPVPPAPSPSPALLSASSPPRRTSRRGWP